MPDNLPSIKSADEVADAMARASQPQPPAEQPVEPPAAVEPAIEPVEPAVPPEPAADATPAEPASEQADAEPRKLMEFADQTLGSSFGQKFKTDMDFLVGMDHLTKRIAQRDEDAVYGRNVRQHEADFREFLHQRQSGQQPAQQPPKVPGQVPPPQSAGPSREQIKAWRKELAREGENASPEAREGVEHFYEEAFDTLHQLRSQPGQFAMEHLAPHLAPGTAQVTRETMEQQSANVEEGNRIRGFLQKHKDWLYQNGQAGPPESPNYTPDGQWTTDYALALERQGYPGSVALDYAHKTLFQYRVQEQQQQQNQSAKPKPVKAAAQHQPAVAAPTGGDPEEEYRQDLKRFAAQEGGLAEHLAKLAAAGQLQQ